MNKEFKCMECGRVRKHPADSVVVICKNCQEIMVEKKEDEQKRTK